MIFPMYNPATMVCLGIVDIEGEPLPHHRYLLHGPAKPMVARFMPSVEVPAPSMATWVVWFETFSRAQGGTAASTQIGFADPSLVKSFADYDNEKARDFLEDMLARRIAAAVRAVGPQP